ncbi:uncharacterized protein C3orf67 homolog [Erpetoichthys calabaricus]|uniref:uncharacterized protein C3orf67 homolog n=1 Tax=Erpetoichthys calabaricus TaxID=27687 RepID=UPI002234B711|nr:uncharacterized protein C3orf67 homolog [Erpetoichthys calabaricus]
MFKNEYQGGPMVEVFSAQGKDPVAKWKICGSQTAVWKEFDKESKSFIYILEGSSQTNKMQLPKDSRSSLGLIQRYLILQIHLPLGKDFSTELIVTDMSNIKRRLYLSTVHKELSTTALHAKIPLARVKRKIWCNLCIDLLSFTNEIFKGAVFLSLDGITVTASCKLRKVFTMKFQPEDTTEDNDFCTPSANGPTDTIPRSCQLGADVPHVTQLINMDRVKFSTCSLPFESDQTNIRGTASARSSRNQDGSHIAFGTKVLGPPPVTGRKSSSAVPRDISSSFGSKANVSSNRIRQSSGDRSEKRSSQPLISHSRIPDLLSQDVRDASPLTKAAEVLLLQPHPPQERTGERIGHRKLSSRSSRRNLTTADDEEWHFPSVAFDADQHDPLTFQQDISDEEDQSDEDKEPQLEAVFTYSSRPHSAPHGRSQSVSIDRLASALSLGGMGDGDHRGARLEDDFLGSDSEEDEDDLRAPSPTHSPEMTGAALHPRSPLAHLKISSQRLPSPAPSLSPVELYNSATIDGGDAERELEVNRVKPDLSYSPGRSRPGSSMDTSDERRIPSVGPDKHLRSSVNRKSLKEIPRSSTRPLDYDWRNYVPTRMSASELHMLASLRRQQNEELENDGTSAGLSASQVYNCNVSISSSSDDTTTWNSCLPPPVNQGHHYEKEMNPLAQSNPRDWLNAFSPPIIPPSEQLKEKNSPTATSTSSAGNQKHDVEDDDEDDEVLTLLYDPCLNCYFDPETGKYYELA